MRWTWEMGHKNCVIFQAIKRKKSPTSGQRAYRREVNESGATREASTTALTIEN